MAQGLYSKNRRITVFLGCDRLVDGYAIGHTSPNLKDLLEAQTKMPPVNQKGTDTYVEGDPDWTKDWANDQLITAEARDNPDTS